MRLCLLLALALAPVAARAQATADDSTAIRAAALDYAEGWYTGDGDRMARALHPELAKRDVVRNADGEARLRHMTAEQLVGAVRGGGGTATPAGERRADVRILDVYGGTAVVRLDMRDWVDHLQLGRLDGEWRIVNVLWELRPRD